MPPREVAEGPNATVESCGVLMTDIGVMRAGRKRRLWRSVAPSGGARNNSASTSFNISTGASSYCIPYFLLVGTPRQDHGALGRGGGAGGTQADS
jgi:hypothetical protein